MDRDVIKRRSRCRGPTKHATTSNTLASMFESAAPAATNATLKGLLLVVPFPRGWFPATVVFPMWLSKGNARLMDEDS